MKDILIVLLIVVVFLITLGAVNHGVTFDLDYVFGTWHHVSLLLVFLIASLLVFAVGLLANGFSGLRLGQERHKLERELEETYKRLRVAEAQIAVADETPVADKAEDTGESAPDSAPADETASGQAPAESS